MLTLSFANGEPPPLGREVNALRDDRGEVHARLYSSGSSKWIDWLGVGVFGFSTHSREVEVWPKADVQQNVVVDAFLMIQHNMLQALGWQVLHAGAAIGSQGAAAFCGKSGSGKSTLAFAMEQAGWRQIADDGLVLRIERKCVMACPLPFKPQLRPASRAHFAHASNPMPFPSRLPPADIPLAVVFVLQQDARCTTPRIQRIPKSRAFSEVLTHAHCYDEEDRGHTRQLVDDYLELVARVPVFTLQYQPDFQQLSQLVRAVVSALSSVRAAPFSPELSPASSLS
jgi:hypothetical protein